MSNEVLKLQFNLFDEGRKYTGIIAIISWKTPTTFVNAPACRERLSNRELVGFYGHRRRELAGRRILARPKSSSCRVENPSS